MSQELPKVNREEFRRRMREAFERTMDQVVDAVDAAPCGRIIRDSEEKARDVLEEFRRVVFETATQMKIDAAEAAFSPPENPATRRPMRNKGQQPMSVLTVNGRLRLRRTRWHDADDSVAPADRWLDEAEATVSEGTREMICRLNQHSSSFAATAANLKRTACLDISKEQVRQLVESEGRAVLDQMRRGELPPDWKAADCIAEENSDTSRLYIGCDGVKVPLVTAAEKQKRRTDVKAKRRRCGKKCRPLPRAKAGSDQPYKEFRLVVLYDETQERRAVSVTRGDHEATGRMLWNMAEEVQLLDADERIANIDGAPWIRNQIEFHGVAKDIGLDYYHLKDNVHKTRRIAFGEESEAGKAWSDELLGKFYTVGYDDAYDSLVAWRSTLRGAKRAEANRLLNYVSERREMIRYPEFREKGWQTGSGPTEAQCKSTAQRVKGRGRRWNADHAESIMALSCLQSSNGWHRYWKNLSANET